MSSNSRNQIILDTLIERICFLHYKPGQRLSETALANEFNVSRTPIRWALAQLTFLNLLEVKLGSGSYVSQLNPQEISALYELRIALYDLILPLGTKPFTPAFIENLKQLHKNLSKIKHYTKESTSRYFTKDYLHFLSIIANKPLRHICYQLYIQSVRFWIALLPEEEIKNEIQGLIRATDDLIDAAESDDIASFILIKKTNLSLNYAKLKHWVT